MLLTLSGNTAGMKIATKMMNMASILTTQSSMVPSHSQTNTEDKASWSAGSGSEKIMCVIVVHVGFICIEIKWAGPSYKEMMAICKSVIMNEVPLIF